MSWSGLNKTAPKLGAIDLNLLVVFDAIMRDRSVTRAGHRLGLSQPAMSHALTRLRHMLKDELFVRSPTGMMPTPRAEELATPIRIAPEGLQQSLEPVQFEPSEATRTFHIAVDNYAAIVLVAPIAARVAKIAPGVTLDFRPSGTLDVLQLLDRSELDSALGRFGAQGERFSLKRLLQDQFVVVHRKGHPAAQVREFSTEKLTTLPQLEISSAQFGPDFVDPGPGRSKPATRPAMRAPFLSAAQILATSDLVSVLPLNVAKSMIKSHHLAFHRLSRSPKPIEAAMIWPRRLDTSLRMRGCAMSSAMWSRASRPLERRPSKPITHHVNAQRRTRKRRIVHSALLRHTALKRCSKSWLSFDSKTLFSGSPRPIALNFRKRRSAVRNGSRCSRLLCNDSQCP
jgi:DNA-binding transcriptional LysR family regulator